MPRRRHPSDDDSQDEDYMEVQASQSQTQTLTQAQKAAANLSPELIERKVGELVQYLLIMEQNKYAVKRNDISKHVLKEYKTIFPEILNRAKQQLEDIFGFELKEIEHVSGKSRTKMYFLLNSLDPTLRENLTAGSADSPKVALLWIVLAIIFMKESVVTEEILWQALNKLSLSQDDKLHAVFGDVRKLLTTEFPRQLYLEYTRIPESDPAAYEFRWGARAHAEVDKEKLLQFVTELYGDGLRPEDWRAQYREVQKWKGQAGIDDEEMQ